MTEKRFSFKEKYVTLDGGVFVIAQSKNDAELISKTFNRLLEENEKLKQTLQKVYDEDYYLKQFIMAIINSYGKNRGVSPIRLEMIWDSSDMDRTSLKHLKSSFYE